MYSRLVDPSFSVCLSLVERPSHRSKARYSTRMPLGLGQYPPEFNPNIHGPYNPAKYYGKPDVSVGQVKLGELGKWLGRRDYNPMAMGRAVGRSYWQWAQRWLLVKKPGLAPVGQFCLGACVFWYLQQYNFLKYHRHTKYHW